MEKNRINATISRINKIKAQELIEQRKLSPLIDNFLTLYFQGKEANDEDLINKRDRLIKLKDKQEEELSKTIRELAIIEIKFQQIQEDQEEQNKEELDKLNKMNKSLKNSGIIDDLIPN